MGLRPRPPDDARCIRPPFPPSSIRAAQPAIWSETWYGPGTQLPNRWPDRFFLRGDGSCQSPNRSPPIGKTIGYLDPSPLWGLVVAWFPGFPCFGCPPYLCGLCLDGVSTKISVTTARRHHFVWRYPGGEMVALAMATDQTCLLYTSPSPRDGLLSRMPSSA